MVTNIEVAQIRNELSINRYYLRTILLKLDIEALKDANNFVEKHLKFEVKNDSL